MYTSKCTFQWHSGHSYHHATNMTIYLQDFFIFPNWNSVSTHFTIIQIIWFLSLCSCDIIGYDMIDWLRIDQIQRVTVCACACQVMSKFLWPHRLQPSRLLCPWDFSGKNPGVGCHAFLQEIFPTQGWNLHLLHQQVDSLPTEPLGSPKVYRGRVKNSKENWECLSLFFITGNEFSQVDCENILNYV